LESVVTGPDATGRESFAARFVPVAVLLLLFGLVAPPEVSPGPAVPPRNFRVSEHLFGLPGLTNVGRVANGIFRGAQPEPEGYATLKEMGVRTVINLRTRHGERKTVEAAGMRYVEIPMRYWGDVDPAVVRMALSVMSDPANQPVYLHCATGGDRTGVVAAVYRMEVDGWSEAEAEMEAFGFHEAWSQLKEFVRRYPGIPGEVREEVKAVDGP